MDLFRPAVAVNGTAAWPQDGGTRIPAGDVTLRAGRRTRPAGNS